MARGARDFGTSSEIGELQARAGRRRELASPGLTEIVAEDLGFEREAVGRQESG